MMLLNNPARYGSVAMTLHWLIALLIIGNICSGFIFAEILSDSDPLRFTLVQLHKPIGLTVLVLSLVRLGWRLINKVPELPTGMSLPMRWLAHGSHYLFYILMIGIPLVGWAMVSSSRTGIPTSYFGLFQWPNISYFADMAAPDKTHYRHMLGNLHAELAYGAAVLLVLHVAAALYHHYSRRDTVLKRMVPGTKVERVPS